MKRISTFGFLMLLTAGLLCSGCGEKNPKQNKAGSANPADYVRGTLSAGENAKATVGAATIQRAIQMYKVQEGKNPSSLKQLVSKGLLPEIPSAPVGKKFSYNAKTGKVKVVAK